MTRFTAEFFSSTNEHLRKIDGGDFHEALAQNLATNIRFFAEQHEGSSVELKFKTTGCCLCSTPSEEQFALSAKKLNEVIQKDMLLNEIRKAARSLSGGELELNNLLS